MEKRIETLQGDEKGMVIRSYFDKTKHNLLTAWIILWSIAGVAILAQFFLPMPEGFFTYLLVWLGFWIYFEYKVILAFRWRKYGQEYIVIDDEFFSIESRIAGRGIPQRFQLDFVKNLRQVERNERSLWYAITSSYWNMGHPCIVFDFKGREVYFGRDLDVNEGNLVLKELKRMLKNQ